VANVSRTRKGQEATPQPRLAESIEVTTQCFAATLGGVDRAREVTHQEGRRPSSVKQRAVSLSRMSSPSFPMLAASSQSSARNSFPLALQPGRTSHLQLNHAGNLSTAPQATWPRLFDQSSSGDYEAVRHLTRAHSYECVTRTQRRGRPRAPVLARSSRPSAPSMSRMG
jgi:hypothetical protein